MTEGVTITLRDPAQRRRAHECVKDCPEGWIATFAPPKRSDEQNRKMWAMLGELSKGMPWHGQTLSPEDYKDLLTAAMKGQRLVPGIEPGLVVLGARTSKMTIPEMSELIEFMNAFAATRGFTFKADRSVEEMAR